MLFSCPGEELEGEVAVAVGFLVEVVLVVLLCGVEASQGLHLHGDGLVEECLLLGKHLSDDGDVGLVGVIYAGAVARASVVPLAVEACGFYGLEEHVEEELEVGHVLVVGDAHGLGIAGGVGIYLFVGGCLGVAVGESHLGVDDALDLFEEMFCAPEAPSGEIDLFHR